MELVIPMILVNLLILVNMLIIICNNFDDSGESCDSGVFGEFGG